MRGVVEKNENFKIGIDTSVIHHWKAGVQRFLKTCYTICFPFCIFLSIYEEMGGEENQNSKSL